MSNDLKPCPFCGNKAEIYADDDFGFALVSCDKCDVSLCNEDSDIPKVNELRVIKKWNRRTKE